jgi:Holliday junction resolvase
MREMKLFGKEQRENFSAAKNKNIKNMNKETLDQIIKDAILRLMHNDCHLLQHNMNERTITYELGKYIQKSLSGYNVDCEYNKMVDAHGCMVGKSVNIRECAPQSNDESGIVKRICPDIIGHLRGTDKNLFVIEAKKSQSHDRKAKSSDIIKLIAMTEQLGYEYGYYLELPTGKDFIALCRHHRHCCCSFNIQIEKRDDCKKVYNIKVKPHKAE